MQRRRASPPRLRGSAHASAAGSQSYGVRVALVNPNTSLVTTMAMVDIARSAAPDGLQIEGITAQVGAPLILDAHALAVADGAVCDLAKRLAGFDGVIVSAFGDPGRKRLQELLSIPVIGIGEASMRSAAAYGRFSVATTTPELCESISILADAYGHGKSLASVRSTRGDPEQTLALMSDAPATETALLTLIRDAISVDEADAVIIGGGPLARAARALAPRVDCPLIEPIPAAVSLLVRRLGLEARERPPAPNLLARLCRTSVPAAWHGPAAKHTFYRLSPFFYAASGLLLAWAERGQSHAFAMEPLIWITQSVLTYYSDVATLGRDSVWHGLDRAHAYLFTALRAAFTVWAYSRYPGSYSQGQMVILACGLGVGLACIRLSWLAVRARRCLAFLRWHAAWHTALPATAVAIALLSIHDR